VDLVADGRCAQHPEILRGPRLGQAQAQRRLRIRAADVGGALADFAPGGVEHPGLGAPHAALRIAWPADESLHGFAICGGIDEVE